MSRKRFNLFKNILYTYTREFYILEKCHMLKMCESYILKILMPRFYATPETFKSPVYKN